MTTFGEIRLARSSFRLSFHDNSFVPVFRSFWLGGAPPPQVSGGCVAAGVGRSEGSES
jgi:hypothetical protein